MKLYELDHRIAEILAMFEPDPETGAINENIDTDALLEELNSLDEKHGDILQWICKQIINLRAESVALKAEEERLHKIRKSKDTAIENFVKILDRECGGENHDFGIGKLSHRRSQQTVIYDQHLAINYLAINHSDCIKFIDPEIRKDVIKPVLKAGIEIPGIRLEDNISVSFK